MGNLGLIDVDDDGSGPPVQHAGSASVKAARRLQRSSERRDAGLFLAEGPQPVREALRGGHATEVFVSAAAAERHPELLATAAEAGVLVRLTADEAVASLASTVTPPGVVAVCRTIDVSLDAALDRGPRLLVVLANARDPGNAGTVLRTADAAGAGAVVLSAGSVDVYNSKCVRASAGSLFHLPVVTGVDLPETVARLRADGLRVLAADGAGDRDLDAEQDAGALSGPTAWLFGTEAWGLPADLRDLADAVVRVPIHGRAESLNLAAAAAVCLYASARAQRPPVVGRA